MSQYFTSYHHDNVARKGYIHCAIFRAMESILLMPNSDYGAVDIRGGSCPRQLLLQHCQQPIVIVQLLLKNQIIEIIDRLTYLIEL